MIVKKTFYVPVIMQYMYERDSKMGMREPSLYTDHHKAMDHAREEYKRCTSIPGVWHQGVLEPTVEIFNVEYDNRYYTCDVEAREGGHDGAVKYRLRPISRVAYLRDAMYEFGNFCGRAGLALIALWLFTVAVLSYCGEQNGGVVVESVLLWSVMFIYAPIFETALVVLMLLMQRFGEQREDGNWKIDKYGHTDNSET